VFQYLGRPAPVSIVILYCFPCYCMTLCANFIYIYIRLCRPRAAVTASIEAKSQKSMEIHFSVNASKSYRFEQSLKTMEIPFHTNSEHGQRHRLTLPFIGPLCNFNGGLILTGIVNAV